MHWPRIRGLCSVSWCLAEGQWNGDQRRPMGRKAREGLNFFMSACDKLVYGALTWLKKVKVEALLLLCQAPLRLGMPLSYLPLVRQQSAVSISHQCWINMILHGLCLQ